MDIATQYRVNVTLETLLFEQMLKPLAGPGDRLASYEMESFAHTLAERLSP